MGSVIERTPPPPQPHVTRTWTDRAVMWVLRPLWAWRTELATAAVLGVAVAGLSAFMATPPAVVVVAVAVGLLFRLNSARRRLQHRLGLAALSRSWTVAVRHAGLATVNDRVPRITDAIEVPCGWRLTVRVPRGGTVTELEEAAEAVAACMQARDVRVTRQTRNARLAQVVVVRHDPLADTGPLGWPHTDAGRLSLWEPVPVGVDEDGGPVTVALPERNVLFGGEPGAGKSAALSLLVATAALDPSCKLTLLDGKLVELASWARCADHTVGVEIDEAIDVLKQLRMEMQARYVELLANRKRKVSRFDGLPLHVVVVDELAHYLNCDDRKQRAEVANLLRDLVSRGRAAGIIVLAATQKPSADVVPTALRDLFGFRWALRCSTPQASDTILGQGWASLGYSAAEIDAAHRGIGYLLHEGGQPIRLRSYYLHDDDLAGIADRAERLRDQSPGHVEVTP